MARYAVVDTNDQAIDGGHMIKWFTGVNWYPSGRWRVNLGYGEGTLDKGGVNGKLHQTLARVQYIFPGAHK
jgi:phosphate-selective porin